MLLSQIPVWFPCLLVAPIFVIFGFSAYSQTGDFVIHFTIAFDSSLAIKPKVLDTLGKRSSTELYPPALVYIFFFKLRNPISLQEVKHKADYAQEDLLALP